jgi:hypothetical protein
MTSQYINGEPYVIYKQMISDDLRNNILEYFQQKESNLIPCKGSSDFPLRKQIREIPQNLASDLVKELSTTLSQYYIKFNPNINNIRLYLSNCGIVKPHVDVAVYPQDTHTCLIYITDDFEGGILSVKLPRTQNHIHQFGESDKKHINITPEPRINYGVIFPKNVIHYTDMLTSGDKLILLIDCEIDY